VRVNAVDSSEMWVEMPSPQPSPKGEGIDCGLIG
jgi:hypothetical protein